MGHSLRQVYIPVSSYKDNYLFSNAGEQLKFCPNAKTFKQATTNPHPIMI